MQTGKVLDVLFGLSWVGLIYGNGCPYYDGQLVRIKHSGKMGTIRKSRNTAIVNSRCVVFVEDKAIPVFEHMECLEKVSTIFIVGESYGKDRKNGPQFIEFMNRCANSGDKIGVGFDDEWVQKMQNVGLCKSNVFGFKNIKVSLLNNDVFNAVLNCPKDIFDKAFDNVLKIFGEGWRDKLEDEINELRDDWSVINIMNQGIKYGLKDKLLRDKELKSKWLKINNGHDNDDPIDAAKYIRQTASQDYRWSDWHWTLFHTYIVQHTKHELKMELKDDILNKNGELQVFTNQAMDDGSHQDMWIISDILSASNIVARLDDSQNIFIITDNSHVSMLKHFIEQKLAIIIPNDITKQRVTILNDPELSWLTH